MILYIIASFFLMIPIGIYFYFYLFRVANFWGLNKKIRKLKIIVAVLTLTVLICSINLFGFGALLTLHILGIALCMEVLNFIFMFLHKNKGLKIGHWRKLYGCGFVPVVITTLIMCYGFFNVRNVVRTHYTVHVNKVIRQQGYKVAMIADLHFGTTMDEKKLEKYCKEIEAEKPDMVALCGDIVDENTKLSQMKSATNILGNIKSTYGTFYIYGNHDEDHYSSKPEYSELQLKNELESNKIHVLEDEVYKINEEFTIVGRKDKGFSSEVKRKSTEDLLKNVDARNFLMLLDHQPCELQKNSNAGIDLQLSGHTHAGQIWPEGLLNEVAGIGEVNYGYKKLDKFNIIVTSGIGAWGYPIRTGSNSEYVIVDLKN